MGAKVHLAARFQRSAFDPKRTLGKSAKLKNITYL